MNKCGSNRSDLALGAINKRLLTSALRTEPDILTGSPELLFLAEAVEKLTADGVFGVRFYKQRTFLLPPTAKAGACFVLIACSIVIFAHQSAITSLGGGFETSLASRFRFCTVAVSRNSSFAPVRPRNLSLVIAIFRFASPNSLSIFLRSRADWLYASLPLRERA